MLLKMGENQNDHALHQKKKKKQKKKANTWKTNTEYTTNISYFKKPQRLMHKIQMNIAHRRYRNWTRIQHEVKHI